MRWSRAICVPLVALLVLCCSGCAGGILLGVSSFMQSPTSAVYAATQLAASAIAQQAAALAPVATPAPTPSAATQAVQADPEPEPTPNIALDYSTLLGAIELIPDTGAPAGAGTVVERYYPNGSGDGYIALEAGTLRNMTDLSDETVADLADNGIAFAIELDSSEPQVLIMHTHATETYRLYEGLYFDYDSTARTTDKTQSVCAVGAIIAQTLNDAGIYTLHDTTLNDYPSYNDSYDNSYDVVAAYLEQYPSIKVVIDVHRDALGTSETWYAPTAEINGTQAAQVMIIAGCDNGSTISIPDYAENLAFAAAWQAEMEGSYEGLTRSTQFNYKYYNQDLTTGSLLLEVGGHGNTLNEALYAGQLAAECLVSVLIGG